MILAQKKLATLRVAMAIYSMNCLLALASSSSAIFFIFISEACGERMSNDNNISSRE